MNRNSWCITSAWRPKGGFERTPRLQPFPSPAYLHAFTAVVSDCGLHIHILESALTLKANFFFVHFRRLRTCLFALNCSSSCNESIATCETVASGILSTLDKSQVCQTRILANSPNFIPTNLTFPFYGICPKF